LRCTFPKTKILIKKVFFKPLSTPYFVAIATLLAGTGAAKRCCSALTQIPLLDENN
jgi:hypothetical protein